MTSLVKTGSDVLDRIMQHKAEEVARAKPRLAEIRSKAALVSVWPRAPIRTISSAPLVRV